MQRHFAELEELEAEQGTSLPLFVRREFASLISCGSLGNGFVRLRCDSCSFERFVAFSCKSSTLCPSCAARRMYSFAERLTESVFPDQPLRQWVLSPPAELVAILGARSEVMGRLVKLFSKAVERVYEGKSRRSGFEGGQSGAVSFLQRFSSTLRLYPHVHSIALDGVFTKSGDKAPEFHPAKGPSPIELEEVAHEVSVGIARFLEKRGLVRKEASDEAQLSPLDRWYANVVRDVDVFAARDADGNLERATQPRMRAEKSSTHGFEVHAKVRVAALDREARLRLAHYVLRPPFAHDQLTQLEDGSISFELRNSAKARGRGSYVILDPIALLRRLAWIIPPPFKNQIIYSGVFAGNAKLRKEIIPRRPAKAREVRMDLPPPPVPPLDVILSNSEISPDESRLLPTSRGPRSSAEPTKSTCCAANAAKAAYAPSRPSARSSLRRSWITSGWTPGFRNCDLPADHRKKVFRFV